MLTIILIPFFIALIIYQVMTHASIYRKEEFIDTPPMTFPASSAKTYSPYGDDISILAHKNAGNIEVLNGRLSKLEEMVPNVTKIQENVDQLNKQVQALAAAKMTPVINAGKNAKPITGL